MGRKIQTRIEAEGSNYAVQSTVTVYTYDTLQRTKNATTPMGVTNYAYDLWKTTETDSKGNSKDIHTDAYGNIVQVDEHNGANTYSTHYEWDGNKNLIKITEALGNVRNFTYDGLSRKLTVEDLHNTSDMTFGVWSYVYDDSGNITQITDPKGQVVNRTYNAINQLIGENFTGTLGTEREFSYNSCSNGIGLLCIATTTDAVTKYKYNKNRLLSEETHIIDNISYVTTYDYDRQGNISSITYPDGAEVRFVYDNAGLLDSILIKEDRESLFSSVVTSINYSPHGKVKKEVFGNNVSSTYTYDGSKFYRLYKKVTTSDSQNIQDLTYIYDSVGNAIRITDDSGTTTRAISYAYDDLYRLLNSKLVGSPSQVLEEFTYNAIGNILSKSNGSGVVAYSYQGDIGISTANPHAPTTVGSSTLMYDNNGNMVSGLGYTNTWNYRNELTQTVKNGNTYSYGYDHAGNRVKFIRPSGTIVYPNKYYNIAGATSTKHIYALGKLIASVETVGSISNPYYIHTDHLGGTDVVTNSSGSKVEDIEYEVFGSLKSDVGTYKESRKYIGQEYDEETDLSYLNARYYDGGRGQFVSQDPVFRAIGNDSEIYDKTGIKMIVLLSDPQQLNSYSYARNNPIVYKDPTGNLTWEALSEDPIDSLRNVGGWQIASLAANVINRPLTATLLRHSASLEPSNININSGNQKQYGNVIDSIRGTSQYKNFLNQAIENAKNGQNMTSGSLQFDKGDLYTAIHRANIQINVEQTSDGWIANTTITDKYDFNKTNPRTYKGTVTRLPATQAYKDQQKGVLSKYDVKINFSDNIK